MNPSISTNTCAMEPGFREWAAAAPERTDKYPWTGLGYTFDWSKRASGDRGWQFVRFGESEFIIKCGAKIEVLSVEKTTEYCAKL